MNTSHTTFTCYLLHGNLTQVAEALLLFCGRALRELRLSMAWVERPLHPILDGSKPQGQLNRIDAEVAARGLLEDVSPNIKALHLYKATLGIIDLTHYPYLPGMV